MTQPSVSMASTADGAPRQPHHGNLKYVAEDGLAAGADVMYAVQFTYSGDEAAKRRAAARVRQAEQQREQAQLLLKQQTSWPYGNQWDGTWNFKYVAHGNLSVTPRQIRDNGYETVFLFPLMQRVPALFRLQPGATRCNREHDDHNEATENPQRSPERSRRRYDHRAGHGTRLVPARRQHRPRGAQFRLQPDRRDTSHRHGLAIRHAHAEGREQPRRLRVCNSPATTAGQ